MFEQADEVIDQGNEWVETEAEQEQSGGAEVDSHEDREESEQESNELESDKDDGEEQEGDDEIDLFLGDEKLGSPTSEEEVKDTDLVKKLRKEIQDRNRELHELRAKQSVAPAAAAPDEPLTMPTLESADWDEEVYQQKLSAYYEQKTAQEKAKVEQETQRAKLMELHNQKLAQYRENASKLGVKGFDEAEKVVLAEVPEGIQGAILHYADKPEIVVLAAGLNPAIRKQLAEVTDPVALGKLIGSIEAKAKLLPKSKQNKPAPSANIRGSSGAPASNLESALEKARKSGNYDEVMRIKRKMKK